MLDTVNIPLILAAAFIAMASPGPATLALAGTSMASGRRYGLALASGITTGSLIWSIAAALGLGSVMLANSWLFEFFRYLGAGYLMYLAFKSARSAWVGRDLTANGIAETSFVRCYYKGLLLHLTNPKPILFFGSLFAIGIPPGSSSETLAGVIGVVGLLSFIVFHGYALVFSSKTITRGYIRLSRLFEVAFALAFGTASLKILTARLQ